MALNKQKGNMYQFVTHMWSPVRGRCSHDCVYCYMKRWGKQKPILLDHRELMFDLGVGRFIFVCHTVDLFAADIPADWISKVLAHCRLYPRNRYLFQSKNPARMLGFIGEFPLDTVLGTTIETNRISYNVSKAPPPGERAEAIGKLAQGFETMVTIEPIIDFDIDEMLGLIIVARPTWVNIGADSKGHKLPEPSKEKIDGLIAALKQRTQVKIKSNLSRIYKKRESRKNENTTEN